MKRLAVVLSFSIALLSVSIEAQAQQQDAQAQQQEMLRLQQYLADQAVIAQTLSNIANMRHQVMREQAERLCCADQGAQQRAAQTQVQAQQYPVTIEECYAAVQRDYANCAAAPYSSFGHCENRRAERLASCSQGVFVPIGGSRKDQCLKRVEEEYRNCGYRSVCTNRWLQGLQECN